MKYGVSRRASTARKLSHTPTGGSWRSARTRGSAATAAAMTAAVPSLEPLSEITTSMSRAVCPRIACSWRSNPSPPSFTGIPTVTRAPVTTACAPRPPSRAGCRCAARDPRDRRVEPDGGHAVHDVQAVGAEREHLAQAAVAVAVVLGLGEVLDRPVLQAPRALDGRGHVGERHGERVDPAGPEHAEHLAEPLRVVGHVLEHLGARDEVERRVGERQALDVLVLHVAADLPGRGVVEELRHREVREALLHPAVQGAGGRQLVDGDRRIGVLGLDDAAPGSGGGRSTGSGRSARRRRRDAGARRAPSRGCRSRWGGRACGAVT